MSLEKLKETYQEIYELTKPECDKCRVPHSCCSPEYCDLATERAAELGVILTPTGHDKLPHMGKEGCVVPPYLRPLCTLHTCDMSSLGFNREDPIEWTNNYWKLRHQADELEYSMSRVIRA